MAKRFFNDDPTPVLALFLGHPGLTQMANDFAKKLWRGCQVVEMAIADLMSGFDFLAERIQPVEERRVPKIPMNVSDTCREPVQYSVVQRIACIGSDGLQQFLREYPVLQRP